MLRRIFSWIKNTVTRWGARKAGEQIGELIVANLERLRQQAKEEGNVATLTAVLAAQELFDPSCRSQEMTEALTEICDRAMIAAKDTTTAVDDGGVLILRGSLSLLDH